MSDENRTQILEAIKQFCSKHYSQHGRQTRSGATRQWYEHDWCDLVQEVSRIEYGVSQPPAVAERIRTALVDQFPNDERTWNQSVASPDAHEIIASMIISRLARFGGKKAD